MSTDARFDKIIKIVPIKDADSVELAIVSNFPCVVRKGEFKEGNWAFYLRDDSKLLDYDAYKEWKKGMDSGNIGPMEPPCSFPWQADLMRYLGTGGRVKTVKLRGKVSMGILLKTNVVCPNIKDFTDDVASYFNQEIANEDSGALYLEKNFGVGHWEAPQTGMGHTDARGCSLIPGLWKTDEENFENIKDSLFPWNEEVLITRKLDGTSCSISSSPDGEIHVMSRSMDLKLESDNVYNRAATPVIPLVKELAKFYGETIVVRGEVTGQGINASGANIDAKGEATFNMFATVFPNSIDEERRIGLWGTPWHFLEVNKKCKELTGYSIKTVPIEGTKILTRQLLEEISEMPRSNGEGRVINSKSVDLPHFKSKSKDYLLHIK